MCVLQLHNEVQTNTGCFMTLNLKGNCKIAVITKSMVAKGYHTLVQTKCRALLHQCSILAVDYDWVLFLLVTRSENVAGLGTICIRTNR